MQTKRKRPIESRQSDYVCKAAKRACETGEETVNRQAPSRFSASQICVYTQVAIYNAEGSALQCFHVFLCFVCCAIYVSCVFLCFVCSAVFLVFRVFCCVSCVVLRIMCFAVFLVFCCASCVSLCSAVFRVLCCVSCVLLCIMCFLCFVCFVCFLCSAAFPVFCGAS